MLNISIIQVFIRAMHEYTKGLNTNAQLGWMCPDAICATSCDHNREDVREYIRRAIIESRNSGVDIILAPYYENVFRNMCGDGENKQKVIWKQVKCAKQTGG
ncbi:unnamed protein product [Cuscuta europaea]|uniref:Uncharacterized protein n=1 Tax=Cuscuta europaea TaxID=41803 RepID=A0A9P0ZRG4_CUSEU|nr:unnamed protein product [Cuscuta europaea]